MSITEIKKNIHQIIDEFDNQEILEDFHLALRNLLRDYKKNEDFWDELSASQQKEIDNALKEVDEGRTTKHESVISESRKWLAE
ncbi:MAG: hypothetical protein FVQ77_10190 [Cytophagales bacterium]|nr:hypothetical protein [Cytophagales bacterium]